MINNIEGQSKSELIKIIEIQQEHDVKAAAEITRLQGEVDKANERVKELELDRDFYLDIVASADRDGAEKTIMQRDIEQQVKGVQRVLDCRELNLSQGEVETIKLIIEQLRKGGE